LLVRLDGANCCGLGALLALTYLELDALTLVELTVALHLDFGLVHEEVLPAVIRLDEPEALGGVEPLHRSYSHLVFTFFAFAGALALYCAPP
jgi:hypothetical protein